MKELVNPHSHHFARTELFDLDRPELSFDRIVRR